MDEVHGPMEPDLDEMLAGEGSDDAPSPDREVTRALMNELVRLRKKNKIGQEPLAKAIGLSQSRVSQIENLKGGSMTLDAFLLYAQTIGVEIVVVPAKKKRH